MIQLAQKIVQEAFADKKDKAGEPYINHLLRVSAKCQTEELKTIALLHDLLEDCPQWNEQMLREFFRHSIVDSVVALTHKPNQTYFDYINQILENESAIIVKFSDLEDNMDITRLKELTNKDFERLKKYHQAYNILRATRKIKACNKYL